jgi:hypothetical protein
MDKHFGNVIWTNHVLERLSQRGIKQGDAWAAWRRPDSSKFNKLKGVWVYQRRFNTTQIEVVAKKNEKGQWIILSVWASKVSGNVSAKGFWSRFKKILFGN